jgi:large subunit ribosomal protein L25
MDRIELTANKREVTGKKVKYLRRKGMVPAHLFGHNVESESLQIDNTKMIQVIKEAGHTRLINLKMEGSRKNKVVMVREIQKDAIKGSLIHVDFYEVNMAENIRVDVPIIIKGEAPALKIRENMMTQDLSSLTVECLPDKLPDRIEIDISGLIEVDQAIRVKDVALVDARILNEPELVVAKISIRPIERVEEVKPVAEAAEAEAPAGAEAEAKAKEETKTEGGEQKKAEKK